MLDIPKPKLWDLAAFAVVAAGIVVAAANVVLAQRTEPGVSLPDSVTYGIAVVQLAVACVGLLVLGKTAKEGTIWGNLAAVAGMLIGLSGILLAGALWAAA